MKETTVRRHPRRKPKGGFTTVKKHQRKLFSEKKSVKRLVSKLSDSNYLGRGEFSHAWLLDGTVIKKNTEESLFNPHIWSGEKGLKRSKFIMESEYETFQLLKDYPILPRFMYRYEDEDGRYYLIREPGRIPLKEGQERLFLPKWKEGSVSRKNYDEFVKQLFLIGKNDGYFSDLIQPGIRDDGSLFLTDLGFFVSGNEKIINDVIVEAEVKKDDYWRIQNYREVIVQLDKLDDQIGMKHRIPKFVIEDNINYYQKQYDERKKENDPFAKITMDSLMEWKSLQRNG